MIKIDSDENALDVFKQYRNRFFSPFKDVQDALKLDLLDQSQDILLKFFAGLYKFCQQPSERPNLTQSRRFQFKLLGTTLLLPILHRLLTTPNTQNRVAILEDLCDLSHTEYLLFLCEYAIRNDFFNCNIVMQRCLFSKVWKEIADPQNRVEIENLHLDKVVTTFPEQFLIFWDLVHQQRVQYLLRLLEREDLWIFLLETVLKYLNFNSSDWDLLENYLFAHFRPVIPLRNNQTSQIPSGPLFERLKTVVNWLIGKHPVDPVKWFPLFTDWYHATPKNWCGIDTFDFYFFIKYFSELLAHPGLNLEEKVKLCEILDKPEVIKQLKGEVEEQITPPPPETAEIKLQQVLAKNSLQALFNLLHTWLEQEISPPPNIVAKVIDLPITRYHEDLQRSLESLCSKFGYVNLQEKLEMLKISSETFKGSDLTPPSLQILVDQKKFDKLEKILEILAKKSKPNPEFCPIITGVISQIPALWNNRIPYYILDIFKKSNHYLPQPIIPLFHLVKFDVRITRFIVKYIMEVPEAEFIDQIADILKQEVFMELYLPAQLSKYSYSTPDIQYLFNLILWKNPTRLIPILKNALLALPNKALLLLQDIIRFLLQHPEIEADRLLDKIIGLLVICGVKIPLDDFFYKFPRDLPIHTHLQEVLRQRVQNPDFPVTIHTVSLIPVLNLEWPTNRIEEIFSIIQKRDIIQHALQALAAFQPHILRPLSARFNILDKYYHEDIEIVQPLLEDEIKPPFLNDEVHPYENYYQAIQFIRSLGNLRVENFPSFRAQFLRCIRPSYTSINDDLKLLPEYIPPDYPRSVSEVLDGEEFLI